MIKRAEGATSTSIGRSRFAEPQGAASGTAKIGGVFLSLVRARDIGTIDLTRWVGSIGLAGAVVTVYFVAARLNLALLTKPEGVAVFWPAAGVSAGVLIALGYRARWPVVLGTMAATIAANEVNASKCDGDANAQSSLQPGAGAARGEFRLIGLLDRALGTLEITKSRLG